MIKGLADKVAIILEWWKMIKEFEMFKYVCEYSKIAIANRIKKLHRQYSK